jgi:hypothetical protein
VLGTSDNTYDRFKHTSTAIVESQVIKDMSKIATSCNNSSKSRSCCAMLRCMVKRTGPKPKSGVHPTALVDAVHSAQIAALGYLLLPAPYDWVQV